MPRYMLSIIQPDGDPPPPEVLDPIMADLGVLNEEMRQKGVWVFAAGLLPPESATVLHYGTRDSELSMTDGPFVEAKEHIGGFTIIQVEDLDDALRWGQRLAKVLSPLHIEVRPMHYDSRFEGD